MTPTGVSFTAAAYLFVSGFFVAERWARDDRTKDLARTESDAGSTTVISIVMGAAFVLMLVAPVLNWFGVARIAVWWLAGLGLILQAAGLVVRVVALRTLGRYFTRTLQHVDGQTLVRAGIYRCVRHPGYLSDLLIFFGAALALQNGIVLAVVVVSFVPAYAYRIGSEERMLTRVFGIEYAQYRRDSWRLIPFII